MLGYELILHKSNALREMFVLDERRRLLEYRIISPGSADRVRAGEIYKGRVKRIQETLSSVFIDLGPAGDGFMSMKDFFRTDLQQDEIRVGSDVLIQVRKESAAGKAARVTTDITWPGLYLVYLPFVREITVSRRIFDPDERRRLQHMVQSFNPDGDGWIVRTSAAGADERTLREEYEHLQETWQRVAEKAKTTDAPACLTDDELYLSNQLQHQIHSGLTTCIITDSNLFERVEPHFERIPAVNVVFNPGYRATIESRIRPQLNKALQPKVWLSNGAYLMIECTAAMTVIDVNSGHFTGNREHGERSDPITGFTKINMLAAEAIARELRLRNIGGIIVIDFIRMERPEDRALVLERLQDVLKHDSCRVIVYGWTTLGLLELTRKTSTPALHELPGVAGHNSRFRGSWWRYEP